MLAFRNDRFSPSGTDGSNPVPSSGESRANLCSSRPRSNEPTRLAVDLAGIARDETHLDFAGERAIPPDGKLLIVEPGMPARIEDIRSSPRLLGDLNVDSGHSIRRGNRSKMLPFSVMPIPETVTVRSYAELTIDGTKLRLVRCFSKIFGPLKRPRKIAGRCLIVEKDFALGYGGDGCTIAKQAPAG
jgi:hypothetical protein